MSWAAVSRAPVLGFGYLLGMVPTAIVVARAAGHDPTAEGSGNPGASNVYRTAGRRAGALVLAGDLAKGAVAAGAGWLAGGRMVGLLAGACAVLGHVLPLRRPGGKGVATAGGMLLVLFPFVGVAAAVLWLVVARLARLASLASLVAVTWMVVGAALTGAPGRELVVLAVVAALVLVRHAGNIGRLVRGEERTLRTGGR